MAVAAVTADTGKRLKHSRIIKTYFRTLRRHIRQEELYPACTSEKKLVRKMILEKEETGWRGLKKQDHSLPSSGTA